MARSTFSPLPVADTSVNEVSGRSVIIQNLLTWLRPGQWTNNLLVFAGLPNFPVSVALGLPAVSISADGGAGKPTAES